MADRQTDLLDIRGLTIALPEGADRDHAVRGLDLSIRRGECVCLVGESGSGKSITAQALLDMLPRGLKKTEGEIVFEGAPLPVGDSAAMRRIRGDRIGLIFQEPAATLDPVMTVGKQIEELLQVHGLRPARARRARALEMITAVRLADPERIHKSYPHQLSGGQAQRIAIAMALALKPALLIADEPTTALDVTTQAEILALIRELQHEFGAGLLFITHDLSVVADIADRVMVMREGEIVEAGSRDAIFEAPRHPYTIRLLESLPRPGANASPERAAPVVLEARDIAITYHQRDGVFGNRAIEAVRGVSLVLKRGETHGLVGQSGSGKSSLVRGILQLEPLSGGTVLLDGTDIAATGMTRAMRKRIQLVQQDPFSALNPRQKAGWSVAEGALIHGATRKQAAERAREMLALVGLPEQAFDRFPHEFSGGQRQRLCIARALVVEPEILVADEAISALDVSIQAQILALFASLQKKLGFAMLFVTHDLRVAASICDEVAVMYRGEAVEQGPASKVLVTPAHDYTRTLLDAVPDRAGRATSSLARAARVTATGGDPS
ncbi:ABC transporter ATP-binding protein [Martelella sp. AD-3]|uniref:dipeptide ABC transporter ATP-binding protein n=1 Tax=Martelella sp. AD-3 TaxID=686597 RepID=UPI00046670C0|nr:ABC transporter ATP-binding protein [Martelella sp. AD-3]AMM84794.1 microcin ABC transporter ATP-binding protein [Martelella sp. AD-3]